MHLFRASILLPAIFLLSLGGCSTCDAAEKLDFDNHVGPSSLQIISNYLTHDLGKTPENFAIAAVDLNGDGLDEFILRDKACAKKEKQPCNFRILAETPKKIIVIGDIPARNLLLGNAWSDGVRNLLAFQNDLNDFESTLYVWEPRESHYRISK